MTRNLYKSKKGAAAFYVVIFTTLLLSVITMSFIRIMISEATKSTNDDLSKSAYDSALAGIEDAKVSLVKYHQCLDQGYTANKGGNTCERIIWFMQQGGCDTVSQILGRNAENGGVGEVRVKEGSLNDGNSLGMEQAYTCVKISEDLGDYRSQVNSNNRVRIIPLRTAEGINTVTGIKFEWFATKNTGSRTFAGFPTRSDMQNEGIPPVLLDLYQTDTTFSLGELSVNNNGGTGTDHASLLFHPTIGAKNYVTPITAAKVLDSSDKSDNAPIEVNCNNESDFKCQTYIAFPATYNGGARHEATSFIRVELPYGTPSADFAITLCTGNATGVSLEHMCDTTANFLGVQAQVDSTGRANDLFRRVEARVELIDTNFPYPEFAIQLTGDSGEVLSKNFWVTRNCWSSDGDNDGVESGICDDSGEV